MFCQCLRIIYESKHTYFRSCLVYPATLHKGHMTSRHVVIVTVFFGYEQLTFQRFSRSVIAFTMAGRQNPRSRWGCFFFGVWVTHPEVQDGPLPGSDTGHHTFHATHEWGGGIKLDSQTCFGKMALFAIFLRELMHELRLVSYSGPDTEIVLNTLKKALERERLVEDKTILFSLTGL